MCDVREESDKKQVGATLLFDNLPENREKASGKKNPIKIIGGGKYAFELDDEMPNPDNVKFVNKFGQFLDKPTGTGKEDIAVYWRNNMRIIGIIMFISSVGLLIIILMASNQYLQGFWDLCIQIFNFVIGFGMGFIP